MMIQEMEDKMNRENLENVGGRYWEKNGKRRVYFNDLIELAGIEYQTYGTGNISCATEGGEKLSNNKASKIVADLRSAKLWYDLDSQTWNAKDRFGGSEIYRKEKIINAIVEKLEAENE
jgi:hypothetical protein